MLAIYYYKNVKNCSCIENFNEADALAKICDLKAYVTDGNAIVYGAFLEKQLIAYVWSYRHQFREEDRIYISEIHVDEEWRSFGIGKRLLRAVEKAAFNRKIEAVYIHAEAGNTRAISLYEREGFRPERVQLRKALGKED